MTCRAAGFLLGALGCAHAARLNTTSDEDLESFVAFEHISFAGGFIEASVAPRDMSHKQKSGKCPWPPKMQATYSNERVVGSGATACVFIAEERKTGVSVAIKVAKKLGKLAGWKKECSDMQRLRTRSCSKGSEIFKLHEHYVPTCIEVGQDGQQAYYVMHAAGLNQVKTYTGVNALKTKAEKTKMFVQLWASVYALHIVGYTHNDLHGGNIVVDKDMNVALIDFGELKGHHSDKGYKHDVNSLWQWSAVVTGCPSNAQWGLHPAPKLRGIKDNYLKCLKKELDIDAEFSEAMDKVLEKALSFDKDQGLELVYKTKFMQNNLPKFKPLFPWSSMDGCLSWDWQSKIDQLDCMKLPGYFQCPQESRPGACYSAKKTWNCWREGDEFWGSECAAKGYEGACLYHDHGKSISKVEEVKSCSSLGTCSNCKSSDWGACYVQDTTGVPPHLQCLCVPPTNKFMIGKSMLKYGCATKQIQGRKQSYDGLCALDSFQIPKPGQNMKNVAVAAPTSADCVTVTKGQKIQCKNRSGAWKACSVVQTGKSRAKVHFEGFEARFDKWVQLCSGDLKA